MYSNLFVVLMGIGTVFFGLICIIVLTTIMGKVLAGGAEAPKAAPAPAPAAAPKAAAPAVDNAPVVAAIAAVLSEELGPAAANMQITSIQKV
ncbi:MAG: OadG family protein [Oscillospiraceae bacterium]|nr:OadG family protein [Oscillospiraceae bacterium]